MVYKRTDTTTFFGTFVNRATTFRYPRIYSFVWLRLLGQ